MSKPSAKQGAPAQAAEITRGHGVMFGLVTGLRSSTASSKPWCRTPSRAGKMPEPSANKVPQAAGLLNQLCMCIFHVRHMMLAVTLFHAVIMLTLLRASVHRHHEGLFTITFPQPQTTALNNSGCHISMIAEPSQAARSQSLAATLAVVSAPGLCKGWQDALSCCLRCETAADDRMIVTANACLALYGLAALNPTQVWMK